MIRWYDYIVCFLTADFLIANIKIALLAPALWMNILGVVGVWGIYSCFTQIYTPYRYNKENNV